MSIPYRASTWKWIVTFVVRMLIKYGTLMEATIFAKAAVYSSSDQFRILLTRHSNKSVNLDVLLNQRTAKAARNVVSESASQLEWKWCMWRQIRHIRPSELEFNSTNQKEIIEFWDKVWIGPAARSTYRVFASNEKHLLCHFTLPNWGLSKHDDTLDFYQHIDLQEMKSYALTLQKPHYIFTFYLSGM